MTISNCFVSGCYDHGTMLDGTWKRLAQIRRLHYIGRINAGQSLTEASTTSRSQTASSRAAAGLRSRRRMELPLKTSLSATSPCATSTTRHSFCGSEPGLRGPEGDHEARRNATHSDLGCNLAPMPPRSNAPSSAASQATRSKTSNSRTSTSSTRVANDRDRAYSAEGASGPLPGARDLWTYAGHTASTCRHVDRLEMSHVEVAPMAMDARPAIVLDNVNRADFYAITAPSPEAGVCAKDRDRCTHPHEPCC